MERRGSPAGRRLPTQDPRTPAESSPSTGGAARAAWRREAGRQGLGGVTREIRSYPAAAGFIAALAALDLIEHEPALRSQLQDNARVLREDLTDAGLDTLGSETHIVPVLVGESVTALRMAERLREEGVFVVAIRPPTVPAGLARIRLSPMATHAKAELEGAAKTIARIAHELGVIKKRGAVNATT